MGDGERLALLSPHTRGGDGERLALLPVHIGGGDRGKTGLAVHTHYSGPRFHHMTADR